jgi:predicted ATPase
MSKKRTRQRSPRRSVPIPRFPNFAKDDIYLQVHGFKAIGNPIEVRIAPLTLISGTNSAGKSSFMQPFLIMKQTIESGFDPGALLLHGPNAKFTRADQTLTRSKARASQSDSFTVKMKCASYSRELEYRATHDGFVIENDRSQISDRTISLRESMHQEQLQKLENEMSEYGREFIERMRSSLSSLSNSKDASIEYSVQRRRCFLDVTSTINTNYESRMDLGIGLIDIQTDSWTQLIRGIIHVAGLRGNPEREYPRSAVGSYYPGTLETYVASIILQWSQDKSEKVNQLAKDLEDLGLTWKVTARKVNDAAVELLVGRMPHGQQGGAHDLVSVADVGFGVSQTLPVVVALLTARPGQIVYLEQPEIHLHPRAQASLAKLLVAASRRGVKVVTETHSSLLIRAVQIEIARGSIRSENVSMNWFSRDEESGFARIDVASLDEKGRFGEWPLDFDDIAQDVDLAYLEAVGFDIA